MSDSFKDFLVEVGFLVNTSEQAKVDAAVKQTEDRITATTAQAAQRRAEIQRDAGKDRLDSHAEVTEGQAEQETTLTKRTIKSQEERAAKTRVIEEAGAKRSSLIRAEQFKQVENFALRIGVVSEGVAGVLSGAIRAAPFGAFLVGVERTASSLSNLAVQSQRVGSSATSIQRFLFAMGQAGVSEGEANGALEGFAAKMRTNPEGYREALERMGVTTLGPDGKPLSYEEMLENMRGPLSRMPYNIAKVQAESFGVTGDNALNALRDQGTFGKNLGAFDDKVREFGMDPDKMAADARKVEQSYQNFRTNLSLINQQVQAEFFVPMMDGFDRMAKWVESHPDETKRLEEGLVAFAGVLSLRVIPPIARLVASLTGLSAIALPAWAAAALGLVASTSPANAGEPTIRPDGSSVYPDGHVVPGKVWDGHSTAEPYAPKDERNWWQKVAPTWLGGVDQDHRIKEAILQTAEATRKLAENVGAGGDSGAAGGGGGIMDRVRRTLGFAATASGDHTHISSGGKSGDISKNPYATKENADAIKSAAKELGTTPEDLATVIAYESGGSFSPSKWGGKGGNYMGLIQFGPNERRQYGADQNQTFPQQMEAVKRYLKDRGFKPGMGLLDLYSTINAGRPGRYGASDGNGTVASHVTRMQGGSAALARAFLARGTAEPAPSAPVAQSSSTPSEADYKAAQARADALMKPGHVMTQAEHDQHEKDLKTIGAYDAARPKAAPMPTVTENSFGAKPGPEVKDGGLRRASNDNSPVKVEVTKQPLDPARQKLAEAMRHQTNLLIQKHAADGTLVNSMMRKGHHHALGDSPALRAQITNTKHGDFTRNGDTFNINGVDHKTAMETALKVSARREDQDKIRYGQGSQK